MITAGTPVEARDAYGEWKHGTAASGVEGTHATDPHTGRQRKVHDFPVVYVAFDDREPVAWPAEDVRVIPAEAGEHGG